MKISLLLLFSLIIVTVGFGQLEPEFFGTYVNEDYSASYTVYTMDEVTADCFIVEYEKYEDYKTVFSETGYGHCDGPNGHRSLVFDSMKSPLEIDFKQEDDGKIIMIIYHADQSVSVFTKQEINDNELREEGEIYFSREDGSELVLYGNLDDDIHFSLYGPLTNSCTKNEISGTMYAKNAGRSAFECITKDGCVILLNFNSPEEISIQEENCAVYHVEKCTDWNGNYHLNK